MTSAMAGRFAAIAAALFIAGCSTAGSSTAGTGTAGSTFCGCPKPVAYDDATIKKITAALRALPPDNVLHEAMDDYEDERDNLRHCLPEADSRQ